MGRDGFSQAIPVKTHYMSNALMIKSGYETSKRLYNFISFIFNART